MRGYLSLQKILLLALLFDDFDFLFLLLHQKVPRPLYRSRRLDLKLLDDRECMFHFRFTRSQIHELVQALGLPEIYKTADRHKFSSVEAMCVVLRRLAFPARWG